MTTDVPASPTPDHDADARAMVLRGSPQLQQVPAERAPAPPAAATPPPASLTAGAAAAGTALPAPGTLRERILAGPPPQLTWALASVALAAGVGWVVERRRRRLLEMERDSVLWASVRNPLRPGAPRPTLDEILPESPDPELSVRSIYASAIGETTSRREATLIDLHQLSDELQAMGDKHDITGAAELLEQHLVDFRYTSPWAFLELRELYKQLERPDEWELARDAFRNRFGQNAPQWSAPSTAADEIADDKQFCADLTRKWPHRDARMFMLRWMLGDPKSRQNCSGPPQLALGVYRDMLLLDAVLDDAMQARPAAASASAA